MTIYLKFPDRSAFEAGLPEGYVYDGDNVYPKPAGIEAVCICGAGTGRCDKPGVYDEDGTEITPPVLRAGFHVNVLGELPESWQQYLIDPPPDSPQGGFEP